MDEDVLVIDNGSYEIKAGRGACIHVHNALMRSRDKRLWLANAVEACTDFTGLQYKRPIEREQLYSWELEKVIWDWMFDSKGLVENEASIRSTTLLLSENPGALQSTSVNTDQIVFEEYEFGRYRRCAPQILASFSRTAVPDLSLVIDVGFSSSFVVPVSSKGKLLKEGVRRLGVGGKVMTNYLKELVSYRYYNMMEETAIINKLKEATCFISLDFKTDLQEWYTAHVAKKFSKFAVGYALPASHTDMYGHVIDDPIEAKNEQKKGLNQILILENERFSVPESLFDPKGHLGLDQASLPETVYNSITSVDKDLQPLLWSNIILCGGSAALPHLKERLCTELRRLAPCDVPVNIETSNNPAETAYFGGQALAKNKEFLNTFTISREEYLEQGSSYVYRLFNA